MRTGVFPCYENQFHVGKTAETKHTISECESCSASIDNGVETWTPFTAEGWQSALQTGKAITISVSAKRDIGDTGNDFIASKWLANGQDAYAYFDWVFPDGTMVAWDKAVISVTNINGGDSTAVAPLEFEVISNGKPTITSSASASSPPSTETE